MQFPDFPLWVKRLFIHLCVLVIRLDLVKQRLSGYFIHTGRKRMNIRPVCRIGTFLWSVPIFLNELSRCFHVISIYEG